MTTTEPMTSTRRLVPWTGALVGLLTGLVILGPALRRGYVWSYDMVFVPDLPLSSHTLGTDGSVPRAVPTDAVVALLTKIMPGDVVQSIALLATFVVVGAGCAAWCRTIPAGVVAAIAATWNPYVVERLVIGHWSFLLGYATLPWVARAARDVAGGDRRRVLGLGAWLAMASLAGSTSALIAAMTAVIVLLVSRGRAVAIVWPLLLVTGALAVLNAAWIIPSFTRSGGVPADPAGVDAFAARSDSAFGAFLSLLTLGGIWHEPSWPASRSSVVTVGVALLVVVALLVCVTWWRLWDGLRALAVVGAVGLGIAALASLPGGHQVATWIVTDVPGGGFIRDSQKFVAPLAVFFAVAAGRVTDEVLERRPVPRVTRPLAVMVAAALGLAPVATLPDAPASAGGRMGAVEIPRTFLAARDHLDRAAEGSVAVFPWTLYRRFSWNHDRVSLDPWNRLLDRRVVVNDDLDLSSRTVRGEDPAAEAVGAELLRGGAQLRRTLTDVGVRWVVLLTDQPKAAEARTLLIHDGAVLEKKFGEVEIYDLGAAAAVPGPSAPWALVISLGFAALLLGAQIISMIRVPRGRNRVVDPTRC